MNISTSEDQATHWSALFISLFLAAGAAFLVLMAMLFVVAGLTSRPDVNNAEPLSMYVLAAGTLFMGFLLLPGVYFNARKFFGVNDLTLRLPPINDWVLIPVIVIIWGLNLILGQLATTNTILSVLVLPIANIVAVALPILLYIRISLRGLEVPSARRGWSILGASMLITPSIALVFEIIAVVIVALLLFAYASTVPGLKETLLNLVENLRAGGSNNEELTRIATSLLLAPGAFIAALSVFSLAIPLIEETFKLAVMWFYLGRIRRPVDGFVLGILCGAAFALAENIGFTSAGSADWLSSIAARSTTALPHIFNSGLFGWALASAWKEHRYGRLLGTFFAVILVHGTWNAISLGLAMNSLNNLVTEVPSYFKYDFAWMAGWIVMAVGTLFGLIRNNRQMRKAVSVENA